MTPPDPRRTPAPSELCTRIVSERDATTATLRARRFAREIGFDVINEMAIATAVSELVTNVVRYGGADGGTATFSQITRLGRRGMQAVVQDRGPGIEDLDAAMRDHVSSRKSLGLGLPSIQRMMDEFVMVSEVGVGTTATIRQWLR